MWTAADDIRKHTKTLEWESHPTQLYEVLQRSISVGYNLIIQYFQEEEEKKKDLNPQLIPKVANQNLLVQVNPREAVNQNKTMDKLLAANSPPKIRPNLRKSK